MSKKINKRIDYIQNALKIDQKNNPNRSVSEFTELVNLIGDQYDDMNTFTIKRTNKSEDVLDRKDTKSIEECKNIKTDIYGKVIK